VLTHFPSLPSGVRMMYGAAANRNEVGIEVPWEVPRFYLIPQFDQKYLSESNPHLDNYFLGTALSIESLFF